MTLLGYLAARTSRIRLGTSVIVLGMRNPFVVAKQAATLDLLSNGRFTLGLGAGYSEPEFRKGTLAASDWMRPSASFGTSGPARQDRLMASSISTRRGTSGHCRLKANGSRSSSAADLTLPSNAQRLLAMCGSRPAWIQTDSASGRRRCDPSRRAAESNWAHELHLSATPIPCWRKSKPSKRPARSTSAPTSARPSKISSPGCVPSPERCCLGLSNTNRRTIWQVEAELIP